MSTNNPAIQVKNLFVKLGGHSIIEDVSFDVPSGQTTAIIGPNGAGKSILVKTILRLISKQSGQVSILGVDHTHYRRIAPLVSYIPQSLSFEHTMPITVQELFSLASSKHLGMSQDDQNRMHHLLNLVGMSNTEQVCLSHLSGGQLQRCFIAYSLLDQPKLLILDEPSAGIDVAGQESIYNLLERIKEQEQLTLLLVSHELDVVMRYASQVLCLNRRLLCDGAPRQVLSNELLQSMYGAPVGHFMHHH